MKPISLIALVALTLSSAATLAQTQVQGQTQYDTQSQTQQTQPGTPSTMPAQTQPGTPSTMPAQTQTMPAPTTEASPTPAPTTVESKVDLTSEPGPPADMRAAREEAVNALHWAKTEGCRSDPSPRDCVQRAQEDYRSAMARVGSGSMSGTMSGSGTSQAGRMDRN